MNLYTIKEKGRWRPFSFKPKLFDFFISFLQSFEQRKRPLHFQVFPLYTLDFLT
ncbi:hypothetical protein Hanom_Chr04g00327961 [Helianthus anomalus]